MSGIEAVKDVVACSFLFFVEIGLVFSVLGTRSKRMRGFKDLSTKLCVKLTKSPRDEFV